MREAKGNGTVTRDKRRVIVKFGRTRGQHRWIAEKALGRPLPEGVKVFHVNGDKLDNYTPFNLVVCPDMEYLNLLRKRRDEIVGQVRKRKKERLCYVELAGEK